MGTMRQEAAHAIELALARGASYAEVRVSDKVAQSVLVRNGSVEGLSESSGKGLSVRLLLDGAWGFAASYLMTAPELARTVEQAVQIARASAAVRASNRVGVEIGPPVRSVGQFTTPHDEDPFAVPIEEKIALLLEADQAMRGVSGIAVAQGSMHAQRERKRLFTSEGTDVSQTLIECGAGISATAAARGESQRRSYPNSFGGQFVTGGFEHIRALALPDHGERIAEEAVALLSADRCPDGTFDLVISGPQVALQVHESCGHPIELDRVFGMEASRAGTSFLTPEKLFTFQYGSEHVNIVADATTPLGLGSYAWDDEGVPAQRTEIVKEGRFVGYLTSRETARQLHALLPDASPLSGGTVRADGWNRLPMIRMTNINLLPGPWKVADLIADTERGLYLDMNRSWSIDDKRLNFQFGCELAYEIRDGKLGRLLRNPIYTGITPDFWGSCDAICDDWTVWGLPNCGKGQPSQMGHVGHGASTARFCNVRVLGH